MSLADDLDKLENLHRSGALNDQEFDSAKNRILNQHRDASPHEAVDHLQTKVQLLEYDLAIMRLDDGWRVQCEQFTIPSNYGNRYVPARGEAIIMIVLGAAILLACMVGVVVLWHCLPIVAMIPGGVLLGVGIRFLLLRQQFDAAEIIYREQRFKLVQSRAYLSQGLPLVATKPLPPAKPIA